MQHFRTNPIITILYGIISILLILFLISSLYSKETIIHIFIISTITFISCVAFFKAIFRKVFINEDGISYNSFMKKKYILFDDIDDVNILNGLGRFILIISSKGGEHIVVSSLFSNFEMILNLIKPYSNENEEEAINNSITLLKKQFLSYIFLMLVVVALLIYIILRQS